MIFDIYYRFYNITHNKTLSVILAYLARFLFFLRFLLRAFNQKKENVYMDERSALELLRETSPQSDSTPDYSTEDVCEEIILSIIVPVYNHMDVLKRCIDSLIDQETDYTYELLLIDDGSTDGAQLFIEEYSTYKNVRVFHQKNGGIAAARNTGICHARGHYIMFVDCDDYVHKDIVEKMIHKAVESNADIVMCAHNLVRIKNGIIKSTLPNIDPQINLLGFRNGDEIMNYAGLPWGKVYKRFLFENVRFFPGYWYEDNIIHSLIFTQCKSFCYLPEVLYEYQWHESNFSHIQGGKGQKKGVDSYWILIAILERYKQLNLEQGATFYTMLLRHLSAYYYTTVSSLSEDIVQAMFILGREQLLKYKPEKKVKLPFMLWLTEKAMIHNNIALWRLCSVNQ